MRGRRSQGGGHVTLWIKCRVSKRNRATARAETAIKDQIEGGGAMKSDKRPKRSKDTGSAREIKNALERTPDNDLLDEVFRRGLIMRAILFKPTDPILLSKVIPPELSSYQSSYLYQFSLIHTSKTLRTVRGSTGKLFNLP
jgi:hypothetical protein